MTTSKLTLGGERFIVLPESEYRLLLQKATRGQTERTKKVKPRRAADKHAGDVAEARKRLANPARESASELFRRLGV